MRNIAISTIRIDGGTQPRETIDQATVDEYAEAMAALEEFPPLVVYHDGVDTWLADGFHRYHGAKKAKWQTIDVDWREGTLEMAKLYAAGANATHGKRRTDADRRRAIEMVWSTEEGKRWSQKQIARHCHVSESWVSQVLHRVHSEFPPKNQPPTRTEQKRAAIAGAVANHPEASDRKLARDLGVDRATVASVRAQQAAASGSRPAPDEHIEDRHEAHGPPKPAPRRVDFANQTHRDAFLSAAVMIRSMRNWKQEEKAMACDELQRLIDEVRNA